MPTVTIIDKELEEHKVEVPKNSEATLLKIIQDAGLDISSACGGGGWAIHQNSRILTTEGYRQVKDLINVQDLTILTEFGPKKARDVACLGERPMWKLKLHSGVEITASPEHRFKRLLRDGTLEWRSLDKIQKGDLLLLRRGHAGLIPEDRGVNPDIWLAIGLLIGDGSLHKQSDKVSWAIADREKEILEFLTTFLKCDYSVTSVDPETYTDVKRTEIRHFLVAKSLDIRSLLPKYQTKGDWRNDGLPISAWSLGQNQMKSLLSGLFSSDGMASIESKRNRTRFSFYSTREQLVKDIQQMLMFFGIITHYRHRSKPTPFGITEEHEIRVVGQEGRKKLASIIDFVPDRKQVVSSDIAAVTRNDYVSGYRFCNELVKKIFPQDNFQHTWARSYRDYGLIRRIQAWKNYEQDLMSDGMIDRFIEAATIYGQDLLSLQRVQSFRDNNGYFDEVTEIVQSDVKEPGYDIRFSETSSYVVNGCVTHNCSTCCVEIKEGAIGDKPECAVSAMDSEDLQTMEENGINPESRVLACQANVRHDCTVQLPYL